MFSLLFHKVFDLRIFTGEGKIPPVISNSCYKAKVMGTTNLACGFSVHQNFLRQFCYELMTSS